MLNIEDWGLIDYHDAWERQRYLQGRIQVGAANSTLVFCQHPSVITVGKDGSRDNILLPQSQWNERGIEVVHVNRGGDVTLHNPGQLIGYTLFRLSDFREDLHWFLREIEECIIETIAEFGLEGSRLDGFTGVWLEHCRKICAIGIHCARWVTAHGFALNVTNDLREFSYIIPCGIHDKEVTSVESERMRKSLPPVSLHEVQTVCAQRFIQHFV
ncbi:MAG: lipoyl(octanoyl) transferase LipB [Bacteroidota bacterium]|nr:lipoyl(octanoyl) transferase LipB [Candidatus Kapabacteria bacterium]MDW8220346.1 lipoyl(octanoyl) transferase LipB [Bacteroidota bacterium]